MQRLDLEYPPDPDITVGYPNHTVSSGGKHRIPAWMPGIYRSTTERMAALEIEAALADGRGVPPEIWPCRE